MSTYISIAAFMISLLSLLVAGRVAILNYRLRGSELRHLLLRDAADAEERAARCKTEIDYLKTIAPGTLFEQELLDMDFPSLTGMEDSLKSLINDYIQLPLSQAIGSHSSYQDRLLLKQSTLSTFENRLAVIKSMVMAHGLPTA